MEIERKFLVASDEFVASAISSTRLVQGYLSRDPERAVRVRIGGERAWLTIKGIGNASGMTRFEFEKEIKVTEAESLLSLCLPNVIQKVRYVVPYEGHTWEVDLFEGVHAGLRLAEVELYSETEEVALPSWIGTEVTGDVRYYNSALSEPKD